MAPPNYNMYSNTNYTNQTPRHDPWNGQAPLRNLNEPLSGVALFDPATDPTDYTPFVNTDVSSWTNNNTDPMDLISPNTSTAPPIENQVFFQTSNSHVGIHLTIPSLAHSDPQDFVNYNQSSELFTNGYDANNLALSPSSPGASTTAQASLSPHQNPVSPFHSAPSPVSEAALYSPHSEAAMMSYPSDQLDTKPPPSPVQATAASAARVVPEMVYNDDSPAETDTKTETSRAVNARGNRPGGRALGTHLEPTVAKAAHDMRKIVACWHCVLQRDKVSPGRLALRWTFWLTTLIVRAGRDV